MEDKLERRLDIVIVIDYRPPGWDHVYKRIEVSLHNDDFTHRNKELITNEILDTVNAMSLPKNIKNNIQKWCDEIDFASLRFKQYDHIPSGHHTTAYYLVQYHRPKE